MNSPVEIFREVEAIMVRQHPEAVAEARQLAADIAEPLTANAVQVWAVLWDKPLYAYTKVEIAQGYRAKLAPFADGEKWKDWADAEHPFVSCQGKANLDASFSITEHAPAGLQALIISRARLYAVGGAARALRNWGEKSATPVASFLNADSNALLKAMRTDLGLRWGHITIMHFLTDMGLSCKPDRWLVRSAHALGIADGCNPDRDVPTRKEAIAIDGAVKRLVRDLYGELTGRQLRYVDKILMDGSRLGVIGGDAGQNRAPR